MRDVALEEGPDSHLDGHFGVTVGFVFCLVEVVALSFAGRGGGMIKLAGWYR